MAEITVNIKKIVDNFLKIEELCKKMDKKLMVITKCIRADKKIVSELIKNGVSSIGDTAIGNLIKIEDKAEKMLMKIPYTFSGENEFEIYYVSDLKIVDRLSKISRDRKVKIMIPLETGELREGVAAEEIVNFVKEGLKYKNIEIYGITINFGCMAGLLPDAEKYSIAVETAKNIRKKTGCNLETVSAGGTVVYDDLKYGLIPKEINHIRIGEGIFTGFNTSLNKKIEGLSRDTFILSGEIIEIQSKNTDIKGKYGYNAFGEAGNFNEIGNMGWRKRAVIDVGFMNGRNGKIVPVEKGIRVIGNSYDFTVLDIEECTKELKIGDKVEFLVDYGTIYYAMLNEEIKKKYIV